MLLSALLRALASYEIQNERDVDIAHITADSRQVTPGAIFVAYPGVNVDGARFISDAITRGAAAILTQSIPSFPLFPSVPLIIVSNPRAALAHLSAAFNDFPSRKLRVIGVTGTDGKTTTCTLIASILKAAGHRVGVITTVGAQIGEEEMDTGFHTTTPDALQMQNYLAQMLEAGMEYAVVEATSHGLAQHRLDAIDFDVAAITNITHEHLDFHKTWEAYRDSKAMLFRSLATSFRKSRTAKAAVLNADDNARGVFDFLREIPADEKIIYGAADSISRMANGKNVSAISYKPSAISHSASGLRFQVTTPFGELPITSYLLGRYNVSNILAAIGVAMARRVPFDAIERGIANVRGVPGRMQVMQSFDSAQDEPFAAIVDFAHTPNALRAALETAREITRGKVILVFGCAGLRDVEKRSRMGEIAGKLADVVVVTAEDPRTESLEAINAQIVQGLERAGKKNREDYFLVNDRAEAIAFAVSLARAGDVVIATGKGHERSMCFGETEFPWSDQDAMRAALKG